MGIHGLSKLLGDLAPDCMRENEIKNYFARKVAVDASMSLYQFLIAVRSEGQVLTDDAGETTSHLVGMFYRTIRMLESGIKPVYVFDGKPPTLKSGELAKRYERRKEAVESLKDAEETGDTEAAEKFGRRTVKVTREHNEEARRLLRLMGVPYIEAPCEAEAQCAALAKAGKVYAAGSEDMDTLTFGAPILLRHLTFSEARKLPICEVHYDRALDGLGLTRDKFIDLCILLGCDYCDSIPGIGPKKAIALIREHGCLENIIASIDTKRHPIPEDWPYADARELFLNPVVHDPESLDIKWRDPDEEGLVQFMVHEKNFNEDRIRNGVRKILKSKSASTQTRLDSFFQKVAKSPAAADAKKTPLKAAKKAVGKSTRGRPRK